MTRKRGTMGRRAGRTAYSRKTVGPMTYITTPLAFLKLKRAEDRTGRSRSDVITHCLMAAADEIGRDTPLVGKPGTFSQVADPAGR